MGDNIYNYPIIKRLFARDGMWSIIAAPKVFLNEQEKRSLANNIAYSLVMTLAKKCQAIDHAKYLRKPDIAKDADQKLYRDLIPELKKLARKKNVPDELRDIYEAAIHYDLNGLESAVVKFIDANINDLEKANFEAISDRIKHNIFNKIESVKLEKFEDKARQPVNDLTHQQYARALKHLEDLETGLEK